MKSSLILNNRRLFRTFITKGFILLVLVFLIFWCGTRLVSALNLNLMYRTVILKETLKEWPFTTCGKNQPLKTTANDIVLQLTQLDPQNYNALAVLANVEWVQGQCDKAIVDWRKAILEAQGNEEAIRLQLAKALYTLGQRKESIAIFKELNSALYFYNLALSNRLARNTASEQQLYELAVEIEPQPEYMNGLALFYQEHNEPELAVAMWEKLANNTPNTQIVHWLALGEAAKFRQNWQEAKFDLKQAITLSTDPYDIYLRLIRVLVLQKDWSGVIEFCEKAVQLKSTTASEPYTSAGKAALEQGNYDLAIRWYDRAIAAIPKGDPWPDIMAGNAAQKYGYLDEAEHRYKAALTRNSDHFSSLLYLAILKYQEGDVQQAITYMESIAYSQDCNVLKSLATWYNEIGVQEKSQKYSDVLKSKCKQ